MKPLLKVAIAGDDSSLFHLLLRATQKAPSPYDAQQSTDAGLEDDMSFNTLRYSGPGASLDFIFLDDEKSDQFTKADARVSFKDDQVCIEFHKKTGETVEHTLPFEQAVKFLTTELAHEMTLEKTVNPLYHKTMPHNVHQEAAASAKAGHADVSHMVKVAIIEPHLEGDAIKHLLAQLVEKTEDSVELNMNVALALQAFERLSMWAFASSQEAPYFGYQVPGTDLILNFSFHVKSPNTGEYMPPDDAAIVREADVAIFLQGKHMDIVMKQQGVSGPALPMQLDAAADYLLDALPRDIADQNPAAMAALQSSARAALGRSTAAIDHNADHVAATAMQQIHEHGTHKPAAPAPARQSVHKVEGLKH